MAQSTAVKPPPIMAVLLPRFTGVALCGKRSALASPTLVSTSMAEYTPFRWSPFIPKDPLPAPTAKKTAWYFFKSSESFTVLPIT